MTRYLRAMSLAALLTTLVLAIVPALAAASETEVREFTIEIAGTVSGKYVMTITKQDDGVVSVQTQANTTYKHLLKTYTYSFKGVEHWKDGRLQQLSTSCNDDGKKFEVTATAGPQALRLQVNNIQRNCAAEAWTTTYWMLADARFHNKNVPLLDADTGKEFVAFLKYVGPEQMQVGGKKQVWYHFQVTGGPTSPCDLWFDGQERLVRQEFTDQGKKVVFILSKVRPQ